MYRLKIKELRKERGLTQTEFAEIMNLNPVTVNRYENNKRFPDISTLISIADYFDVPLDELSDEGRKKVIDYFNLIRNSEKLSI